MMVPCRECKHGNRLRDIQQRSPGPVRESWKVPGGETAEGTMQRRGWKGGEEESSPHRGAGRIWPQESAPRREGVSQRPTTKGLQPSRYQARSVFEMTTLGEQQGT